MIPYKLHVIPNMSVVLSSSVGNDMCVLILYFKVLSSNCKCVCVCVKIFQSVSGLRLTDTFLKRTYEYDDIAQVCVVCPFWISES